VVIRPTELEQRQAIEQAFKTRMRQDFERRHIEADIRRSRQVCAQLDEAQASQQPNN
jgi:hypothetical protein